jgi:two-component system chemotaxis response regulator CheY
VPLNLKKVSILVAEDLQPMRTLIVSVLDAFGIGTIYEASNGENAYRLFQKHNPDIVITDWLMEPVDGLEFIRMIRREEKSVNRLVPVIMMTGYSAMQRVTLARDLGATEFLTKPFTGRDLAKRINLIINRPRDFVETENFFGPNRRRKKGDGYSGPRRRADETGRSSEVKTAEGKNPWEIMIE